MYIKGQCYMYSSRIGVQDYVPCAACCWTLYVYTCEWSLDAEMLLSWIPKTYWSAYLQDYLTATDQCVVLSHQHQQNSTNSQQHLYSLLTSSFYLSGAIFIYFIFSQNYIQTSVDMHWKNMSRFLAHLRWKLNWAFLITRRPSSVYLSVCLSVNFSHFHLLLQNHWANFNQTWHKASLGEGDSSLFKWRAPPFSKGR